MQAGVVRQGKLLLIPIRAEVCGAFEGELAAVPIFIVTTLAWERAIPTRWPRLLNSCSSSAYMSFSYLLKKCEASA